eukprot:CAMPEP_0172701012 /NCGR_PEP_ID=MMETSP1074-20121228/31332_1 /TAXON_ID=2916 /ORGANISM="Ceratium fusus, Strain PA161109" /LENGTH=153 /DNA_ID=CAMNT_0013522493 /DNA_START=24 /DNA_END=482 /DNA_ORIENTATION=-
MTVLHTMVLMSHQWFAEAAAMKIVAFQPICEGDRDTCGWPAGRSMLVAGRMMADRINAGGFLRGNHTLDLIEIDTHCSPRNGIEEADKNMIDTAVRERSGGFEQMNHFVRASMQQAVVAAKDQLEENLAGLIERLDDGDEKHLDAIDDEQFCI